MVVWMGVDVGCGESRLGCGWVVRVNSTNAEAALSIGTAVVDFLRHSFVAASELYLIRCGPIFGWLCMSQEFHTCKTKRVNKMALASPENHKRQRRKRERVEEEGNDASSGSDGYSSSDSDAAAGAGGAGGGAGAGAVSGAAEGGEGYVPKKPREVLTASQKRRRRAKKQRRKQRLVQPAPQPKPKVAVPVVLEDGVEADDAADDTTTEAPDGSGGNGSSSSSNKAKPKVVEIDHGCHMGRLYLDTWRRRNEAGVQWKFKVQCSAVQGWLLWLASWRVLIVSMVMLLLFAAVGMACCGMLRRN